MESHLPHSKVLNDRSRRIIGEDSHVIILFVNVAVRSARLNRFFSDGLISAARLSPSLMTWTL